MAFAQDAHTGFPLSFHIFFLGEAMAEPPWLPLGGRRRSRWKSLISWCFLDLGSYLERSEDVDEVEGRAMTFSVEVLDLVVLSRVEL